MKYHLQMLSLGIVLLATVVPAATRPDLNDNILILYSDGEMFSDYWIFPDPATQFSATDGKVSDFWSFFWDRMNVAGLNMDYAFMASDYTLCAWNRCVTEPFYGHDDAKLTIRGACGAKGVYLYIEVEDDSWVESVDSSRDMVAFYFDQYNTTNGLNDSTKYINHSWAITATTKKIFASVGSSIPADSFIYGFYDTASKTMVEHRVCSGDSAYDGMAMEVIHVDSTHRVQEWFIPWRQWLGPGFSNPSNTQFGFTIEYNDADSALPGCSNTITWQGLCDPQCGPSVGFWGNIEVPGVAGVLPHKLVPSRPHLANKVEYYTFRGERISGTAVKASSLIVKRHSPADGIRMPALIGFREPRP
jgi:hypothetical protein